MIINSISHEIKKKRKITKNYEKNIKQAILEAF